MASLDTSATHLLGLALERALSGDTAAMDELLRHSSRRLTELARGMLRGYPGVRRWADTDDVLQNALLRLVGSLRDVRPASAREFFGLATLQIRRELIDLARHYYGAHGHGANHESHRGDSQHPLVAGPADENHEPSSLAEWREFHEQMGSLPDEEREIVSLLFYQGLTQSEAAEVLGISVRTVQRRWHDALHTLHQLWPSRPS